MNYDEIEDCVAKAQNGNKQALEDLLQQYKPFILKTIRGCSIKNFDMYDLIQTGYVGLLSAITNYKLYSNTLSGYAFASIRNSIGNTVRQNCRFNGEISFNTPLTEGTSSSSELLDRMDSGYNLETSYLNKENALNIQKALKTLPPEELELINSLYYKNSTLKAYAINKGVSYQNALRNKGRILDKLNKSMLN